MLELKLLVLGSNVILKAREIKYILPKHVSCGRNMPFIAMPCDVCFDPYKT
jgi:hypothetical protein